MLPTTYSVKQKYLSGLHPPWPDLTQNPETEGVILVKENISLKDNSVSHCSLEREVKPFPSLDFKYNVSLEKGSDQLVVKLYTPSVYPFVYNQLTWTLF